MTDYLTFLEVQEMHHALIERYGGAHGLRDPGALEAALFRPQCGYYDDLIQEAAALWESLTQNHPFVDGNKRIAFAALVVFLDINGRHLNATPTEAESFIFGLFEQGHFEFDYLEPWLRANVT